MTALVFFRDIVGVVDLELALAGVLVSLLPDLSYQTLIIVILNHVLYVVLLVFLYV